MNIALSVLTFIVAYIAGSIPSAVWAGKLFHGVDIREHGSGNAGATNTIRILGWRTGIPVLAADILKGALAALLPVLLKAAPAHSTQLLALQIVCGMAAITGHVFPLFAGFRGGKGVATAFGILLAIQPWATLLCAAVFLTVLFISGYVSIASLTAGVAFPVLIFTIYGSSPLLLRIFSVVVAVALIITHSKNIKRLINGEEKKFILRKKKSHRK